MTTPIPATAEGGRGRPTLRILFVMRHNGYLRNWEWVIRELLSRGHRVHLGFELDRERRDIVERLVAEFPGLSYEQLPPRDDGFAPLARTVGGAIDYLRYLTPPYEHARKLRRRARKAAPKTLRALVKRRAFRGARGLRALDRAYRKIESWIPDDPPVTGLIEEGTYDVVMATPLVSSAFQHGVIRAAQRLGRFTVLPVTSWDNLTNKGLVRVVTDRVYVWNEPQRREAIDLHGLPAERVVAVGAHTYDHWFDWKLTRTREELCSEAGLDPARPFILYVCSSGFIMEDERPLVRRWIEALRARGQPRLRDAGVLVRPHPRTGKVWVTSGLEGLEHVAVWPPLGADPRMDDARAAYFDSLSHAAAVVGINTSALVEAAIVGKASYTLVQEETRDTQEGTLHFHHLLRENGGPLAVASSTEEHLTQLAHAIDRPAADRSVAGAFVASFIRPRGRDVRCAPALVDDLEAAVETSRVEHVSSPGRIAAPLASMLARVTHRRTPRRTRRAAAARARQRFLTWPRVRNPGRAWASGVAQTRRPPAAQARRRHVSRDYRRQLARARRTSARRLRRTTRQLRRTLSATVVRLQRRRHKLARHLWKGARRVRARVSYRVVAAVGAVLPASAKTAIKQRVRRGEQNRQPGARDGTGVETGDTTPGPRPPGEAPAGASPRPDGGPGAM